MIKLYLDENIPESVAIALKLRGYYVVTTNEVGNKGLSDVEQLTYTTVEGRVILTFDIVDYCKLHSEWLNKGLKHGGIILTKQRLAKEMTPLLTNLLFNMKLESIQNNIVWLNFKS